MAKKLLIFTDAAGTQHAVGSYRINDIKLIPPADQAGKPTSLIVLAGNETIAVNPGDYTRLVTDWDNLADTAQASL